MKTYPLTSFNIEEATKKQFSLIDEITKIFRGSEILTRGDLGVIPGLNQPRTTNKVEKVLGNYFNAEAAMLVRGAGTMAIRMALHATMNIGDTLLVHDAPVYPTTKVSIDTMGLKTIATDFNDLEKLQDTLKNQAIDGVLIQITRQKPDDSYDAKEVIQCIKNYLPNTPIVTDDNYAVLKTPEIGSQMGATLACFSTFKLLGPEGIGCIVGNKKAIEKLKTENYSGGLQVQGHEAIDVLRGMIYAPVALALSARVLEEVRNSLNAGEVTGVKQAYIANAQSKVILVELDEPIASAVLEEAEKMGAAPNPVGAESQYEFVPMFYRLSGTFRAANPDAERTMIRINPMRAGSETIIRILHESIIAVSKKSR